MGSYENIGLEYVALANSYGHTFLKIILLALIVGLFIKVDNRVQRSTYIFFHGLLFLSVTLLQLLWVTTFIAASGNYLTFLVIFDILIGAVAACSLIIIAKARSNDAYGTDKYAFLSIIPGINLWLFLVPSKDEDTPEARDISWGPTFAILGCWFAIIGIGVTWLTDSERSKYNVDVKLLSEYLSSL